MFERLTTDDYYINKYEPTILSQPPKGPWLITLENVATEEQCKHMVKLGGDRGYERSSDVGLKKFDGTFDSKIDDTRTSHGTWCLEECYNDETHQKVLRNVENITGIPDTNSEYWQLLRYEQTQRYGVSRGFLSVFSSLIHCIGDEHCAILTHLNSIFLEPFFQSITTIIFLSISNGFKGFALLQVRFVQCCSTVSFLPRVPIK